MQQKPNVLILLTDQQRWDTINHLGHNHMITPNLDRLAKQGCAFINAHTPNPVCQPARHSLLTGLPEKDHGYYINYNQPIKDYAIPTLPGIFSENRYRTCGLGKMHFFPVCRHHGFNELKLMEEVPFYSQDDAYKMYLSKNGFGHIQNIHGIRPHIYHLPQLSQVPAEQHGTFWLAGQAVKWLKSNEQNPFFLMVNWIHPHPPWNIPEDYIDTYSQRQIPDAVPVSRSPLNPKTGHNWYGDSDPEALKTGTRKAYFASITMVDQAIGRILDYLEDSGQINNTLIIFTSDHGEMLQDKGHYSKELPYNGSVRIPLIVRYPEIFTRDSTSDAFCDLYDILPTCLKTCGLPYPETIYQPMGCALQNKGKLEGRKYQLAATGGMKYKVNRWVMCRDRRFKYIYNYNRGYEEFFDLGNDPGEITNLMTKPELPRAKQRELKEQVLAFEKIHAPEEYKPENELIRMDNGLFSLDEYGKFHYFMNRQMHKSDISESKQRAIRFVNEFNHAVSNEKFSVIKPRELLNDPVWIESFRQSWQTYTGNNGEDIYKIIDLLFS